MNTNPDSSRDSSTHVEPSSDNRVTAASATRPATRPDSSEISAQPVENGTGGAGSLRPDHPERVSCPRLVRNDSSAIGVLGAADESGHVAALGPLCDCNRCLLDREMERAADASRATSANYAPAHGGYPMTAAEILREHDRYRQQLRAEGAARDRLATVTPIRPVDRVGLGREWRERVGAAPVFLNNFRGQVSQARPASRGEIAGMLGFAAVVGTALWELLP